MAHLDPELLSAYIDHELPPADMAAAERHLAECETCRAEYEELRALSSLVRGLPVYLPKREIDVRTADTGQSETLAKIIAFSKPLAIAAVVLLIAFAGLRLLTTMNDEDAGEGDQISFSAVQPTPGGTEPAGGASEEQAAEVPAAAAPSEDGEAGEPPASDSEAPLAAMQARQAETPVTAATVAPAPTATPEPAADGGGDSWLAEGIVALIAVALAGAAGWYRFGRSPARRRG